jgi:hypothetical protein
MKGSKFGLLLLALIVFVALGLPERSAAEVNVNVGVFAPPPMYRIAAPPPMVVIPGTYVYAVPNIDVDILFYGGSWYRPHEGHWYRAKSYNGPWAYLAPPKVPRVIFDLPPDHRRVPPGHRHIPYGQFKKNWGKWERNKHWDNDKQWQEGRRGWNDDKGHDRRDDRRDDDRRDDNRGGPKGHGNEGFGPGPGPGGGPGGGHGRK